jgi:uncharacterized Zn finger protein
MSYFRDYYPPRSTARKATGGIKARSGRGRFANNWWSQRWIAVLESFRLGTRLTRGRAYARSGQVLSINITPGLVVAAVQGSRVTPYRVKIAIKELSEAHWQNLAQTVFSQAIVASKLLAGEMPEDLEQRFADSGVSLFPEEFGDLRTNCSCPDWANPCKHTAAVYYLLAEEFDHSPMLLLTMRGITNEKLMTLIGEGQAAVGPGDHLVETTAVEELPKDPRLFWGEPGQMLASAIPAPMRAIGTAALTRQLGSVPFWRGEEAFQVTMERLYADASKLASDMLVLDYDF